MMERDHVTQGGRRGEERRGEQKEDGGERGGREREKGVCVCVCE